jgi:ParB-like chromosome segregation protein Spo0J
VSSVETLSISAIAIGKRFRRDMGDIAALAESIKAHGLLHPPAVTSDYKLIAGHRRIDACALLGWTDIPVRVIDVADLLSAERDENRVRKNFTPSEAVAIAREIEAQLKAASHERRSASAKARWAREKGGVVIPVDSTPITAEAATSAAHAIGMGRNRYNQAKEVVEAAEQEAEKFGDIVERMDATGNVGAAHNELRRRRDKQPLRHAALRNTLHRDPNKEVERAITSLAGLAMGFARIDQADLDQARIGEWAADLKRHLGVINRFVKGLHQ